MYDACFYDITRTVGDKIVGKTAEDPPSGGALEFLHELGHAMALREHRVLYQQYLDALKAENNYAAKFRGVTMSEGQFAKVQARHKALGGATDAAKQRWKDSIGRAEHVLGKLRARPAEAGTPKPEISEYSRTSDVEMFAEASTSSSRVSRRSSRNSTPKWPSGSKGSASSRPRQQLVSWPRTRKRPQARRRPSENEAG